MDAELTRLLVDTLWTATKVASPILIAALVTGVAISLIQTVLQVQEATLTFVPKLAAIGAVVVVSGNWMLLELAEFMRRSLEMVPQFLAGLWPQAV